MKKGNSKLKTIVTAGLLFSMLLPFVLQTDLYPFFRFGMFAEPVRYEVQLERFVVIMEGSKTGRISLDPLQVGIRPSTFDYLLRNYHYRNEHEKFLKNLGEIWPEGLPVDSLEMVRILNKDTFSLRKIALPVDVPMNK